MNDKITKVNLIFIGFKIESIEFNKIVNEHLPANSVIYHIDFKPFETNSNNDTDITKSKFPEFYKRFPAFFKRAHDINRTIDLNNSETLLNIYKPINLSLFSQNTYPQNNQSDLNTLTSPLSELMSVIWRICYNYFRSSYKPRSIGRHEIISYLLYEPNMGQKDWIDDKISDEKELDYRIEKRLYLYNKIENNPNYFLDRVLIEIALAVNRNNGLIDLFELSRGRVGKYYKQYLRTLTSQNSQNHVPSLYELLYEIVGHQSEHSEEPEHFKSSRNIFKLSIEKNINTKNKQSFIDNICVIINENINTTFIEYPYSFNSKKLNERKKDFSTSLKNILSEYFDELNQPIPIDKLPAERTLTLIQRLFSSKWLSNRFKLNLLNNFDKKVFNGLVRDGESPNVQMLKEVFRLFKKTVGKHYLIINASPEDTGHFIFESFEKKNLIHTNLGLSYEFNNIFFKQQWDILLLVSETGSNFDFLNLIVTDEKSIHDKEKKKKELGDKLKNKHIILICSYESVKQLYVKGKSESEIIKEHKKKICAGIFPEENLTLCFVPWREHNHHGVIFLKAIRKNDLEWETSSKNLAVLMYSPDKETKGNDLNENIDYGFICSNSIYMYRNGLSNSMDPLFIGVNDKEVFNKYTIQDQYKLLTLFYIPLLRSAELNANRGATIATGISKKHISVKNIFDHFKEQIY